MCDASRESVQCVKLRDGYGRWMVSERRRRTQGVARRGDENCPFRQLLPGSDRSAGEGPEALFTGRPGFYRPAHKALSASGRGMLFPSSETLALVKAGDSEV